MRNNCLRAPEIAYSYDVMHRIPSLTCSEPGCAGKHCYL